MSDDLISRQDAIKAVTYGALGSVMLFGRSDAGMTALRDIVIAIKQLSSAQPEIIYCKDCLYWMPGYITDQDDFIPSKCGKYQQMVGHSGDDYCSYAERKDDE